jgi:predicted nucleotidyltransferase
MFKSGGAIAKRSTGMKLEEIIKILKPIEQRLHSEFDVAGLYIFGSVARGEALPTSDIDVLVDFKDSPTFAKFMDLKFFLEDMLGIRVDLVTRNALRPEMKDAIEEEAKHVA